ncbi:MAG: hypothetical protein WC831_06215 [Parcubacteria group bacterium]|jgi:hypothetical protein
MYENITPLQTGKEKNQQEKTLSPDVEAAQILTNLNEKRESADKARDDKMQARSPDYYPTREGIKKEEVYNNITDLVREARIIADPEVQRFAKMYATLSPEEIQNKKRELNQGGDEILRQERETGIQRTPEMQKKLDELRIEKNGLIMAGNGGINEAIKSLKKRAEQQGVNLDTQAGMDEEEGNREAALEAERKSEQPNDNTGEKKPEDARISLETLDSNLLEFDTEEKQREYVEQLKQTKAGDKINIYHGTRGGASEVLNILKSNKKGVKGGEQGSSPTFAVFPVGVYWNQEHSAGFRYSFDRNQVQFPGDSENPNAAIFVDTEGMAFVKKGIEYMPLDSFEGEAIIGPKAKVEEGMKSEIIREMDVIKREQKNIKPIIEAAERNISSHLLEIQKASSESGVAPSYIQERISKLLPLTADRMLDGKYEDEISRIEEKLKEELKNKGDEESAESEYESKLQNEKKALETCLTQIKGRSKWKWKFGFTKSFLGKIISPEMAQSLELNLQTDSQDEISRRINSAIESRSQRISSAIEAKSKVGKEKGILEQYAKAIEEFKSWLGNYREVLRQKRENN